MNGMQGTKETIRRAMRRRRRSLAPAEVRAAALQLAQRAMALPAYRGAGHVLAYWAVDGEAPTEVLIERSFAENRRVYLPRMAAGQMIFAEYRPGATLRPGAYAIPEPRGAAFAPRREEPFVVFVPLVAWDDAGTRVGRGKGCYDRALSALAPGGTLVGLGYAFQQCANLPREPWDVPLQWVVTERAALRCGSGELALPVRKEGTTRDGVRGDRPGQRRSGRGARLGAGCPPAPPG